MNEKEIFWKIVQARISTLRDYPFFGRLLLRLRFGLAECETAFTDMRRIVFDPAFAERLSQEQVQFVLLHEVLHCALKHCTRGAGKQPFIYNVACDIVVNSTILEMYQKNEILIDGEPMMHLAPDGVEGREYTADKIYEMLMKMSPESFDKTYGGGGMDNHEIWAELPYSMLEDLWNHHLKEVAVAGGVGSGIPSFMARYLKEITHAPRTNWRQILHDFIQFDKSDYDFCRPDRRLLDCAILPSFCDQLDGGRVEKLWFLVDTSGSVSDEALSVAYEEIKQSASQIDNMSGMLSFFDHRVSEPIPFESLEDILEMKPIGGGGTSFYNIFKKLGEFEKVNELPNVMVIITDGYDTFPEEEMALGVPVIWMIVDSEVVPPWGTYAYISTSEEDER